MKNTLQMSDIPNTIDMQRRNVSLAENQFDIHEVTKTITNS